MMATEYLYKKWYCQHNLNVCFVAHILPRTNITVSNAFIIGEQAKFLRDLHTYLGSHSSGGWIRTWTYLSSYFTEQKSVKRKGLLKGKFAYFRGQLPGSGVGRLLFKGWLLVNDNQWTRALIRWSEGTTCRNSTVSSDGYHEIGHWQSDQCHLDCFKDR